LLNQLLHEYRIHLNRIDAVFDDVRRNYPDAVPCHAGCSQCCYALFAIPPIDGFLLLDELRLLPIKSFAETVTACKTLFESFRATVCPDATLPFRIEGIGWKEFESMAESFCQPCPFLTMNGYCGVYASRPRICRLAGTVFVHSKTGIQLPDYCDIAATARKKTGFLPREIDFHELDMIQMEFNDALRNCFHGAMSTGYTFPVAGILEALQFTMHLDI
jgi:Fe-S-cluster containining protein